MTKELKELTAPLDSKSEKYWTYAFRSIGTIMFIAGIWESLITLFWLDKEVVGMNNFKIGFAAVGFVFALAGKNLGVLANKLGIKLIGFFGK